MNSRQIESWALRIIDCVKRGQPNEDSLVELKRDWIAADKAARRIAGHANAARGENILWLIGVDEKQRTVPGASFADLASWYPTVESCFSELAPRMIPLNIPVDDVTVVALLFETDRAPFIIKNPVYGTPGGGAIELEVPWRENTSVRSARRSEIIRLLAPLRLLPDIELLDIQLSATVAGETSLGNYNANELKLNADLYIVPKDRNRIVIPFHRCRVEFEIPKITIMKSSRVRLKPATGEYYMPILNIDLPGSLTIQSTAHEIIIDDPGKVSLQATAEKPSLPEGGKDFEVSISIYLFPADADYPIVLAKTMPYPKEKEEI